VSAFVWAAVARADPEADLATSNALFEEAKRLQAEGHVAEACDKYAQSYRLAPRGGTLLNLGLCHEDQGKLLDARRELTEALAIAKRDGRADRVPVAEQHLAAIEGKLSFVEIVPPPNAPADLEIKVDDAPVPRDAWGRVPVEAGRHVVRASSRVGPPREIEITIGPAEKARATIPPFEVAREAPRPSPPPPSPPPSDNRGLRTAALVAGLSGLGISLVTGAWALDRKVVVRDHCLGKACDQTGADAASLGRVLVIVSTAAFGVGVVGFGAWLLLPDRGSSAGVTIGGNFR
jgi:hypothetical protein